MVTFSLGLKGCDFLGKCDYSGSNYYKWGQYFVKIHSFFNSHVGGMAVSRPYGFEIDFVKNPITKRHFYTNFWNQNSWKKAAIPPA